MRKATFEQFNQIFNTETEEEEEQKNVDSLNVKWGWYQAVFSLANENLLDFDQIVKKPAYECLTFMAYKQDLNKKRQDEYRQHKI